MILPLQEEPAHKRLPPNLSCGRPTSLLSVKYLYTQLDWVSACWLYSLQGTYNPLTDSYGVMFCRYVYEIWDSFMFIHKMFQHVPRWLGKWFKMFPHVPGWLGTCFMMLPHVPGWHGTCLKMFPHVPGWLGTWLKCFYICQNNLGHGSSCFHMCQDDFQNK